MAPSRLPVEDGGSLRMRLLPSTAITAAAALVAALATVVFVASSFGRRPFNPVEAELTFEALRIARGLPLYVDPFVGALDGGPPAARYYVLYTAIWPWIVGHLAAPTVASVRDVGRALSIASWLVLSIAPVFAGPRPTAAGRDGRPRENRARAVIAAMAASSLYFLTRNAPAGTPDTLASALACLGLVRAARRDRFDAWSAVLLVAAPFTKPSCLGIFAGAAIVFLARRQRGSLRAALAGLACFVAMAAACHFASGGEWVAHLVRSTGQPLSFERWVDEVGSRVLFLGVPHLVVAWLGYRARVSWVALGPLLTSIAWSTFSMAKNGSGTHYWLEPTAAAIVVIALLPAEAGAAPSATRRASARWGGASALVRWAGAALAVTSATVTLSAYAGERTSQQARAEVLAELDRHCVRGPGELVAAQDIEVELVLDGRILVPEWQSSFLVKKGRFPIDAWRADLRDPHVRWLVLGFDIRTPHIRRLGDDQVSAYHDELRDVVDDEFAFDAQVGGMFVYRKKPAPGHPAP